MTFRAQKYRFYPTDEQVETLAQTFGTVRFVYNTVLAWRTEQYRSCKANIGYKQASAKLTELRHDKSIPWLAESSSVAQQQCLRHQQTAFKNFFSGTAKYPNFKKKNSRQSFEMTKSGFKYREGKLYIAKCKEPLDIRWSRELSSEPSTITISKDAAGRYFVSLLCEFKPEILPVTIKRVGIDLGIKDLLTLSNGHKVGNPRHTKKYANKLAKLQRRLSKKKLGSANRYKARLKVARTHAKISDCRQDFLHKESRRLVNENQVICVETLRVRNMIRNRKLSKHISDCGWGEFTRQLEYKADWAGRSLVKIDQFFPSSKTCSGCGYVKDSLPLNVREWECPSCSETHDRDINAAKNILTAGQAGLAFGENVIL